MKKLFFLAIGIFILWSVGYVFATDDAFSSWNTDAATELESAVTWMYDNGFTFADTVDQFKPTTFIKREEAAKFFVQFADQVLWLTWDASLTKCSRYSDGSQWNSTLRTFVVSACQLGILKWANNKIRPKDFLTNAHAVAILMRMIDPTLKDTSLPNRSNNYYRKANKLGLLDGLNMSNTKSLVSRWTVARLIYRAAQQQSWSSLNDYLDNILSTGQEDTINGGLPDLVINSMTIVPANSATVDSSSAKLVLVIKNIGSGAFHPNLLALRYGVDCYSDVSWEGWYYSGFQLQTVLVNDYRTINYPNSLFKTFLTEAGEKQINCVLESNTWYTLDGNDVESDLSNNASWFAFTVE